MVNRPNPGQRRAPLSALAERIPPRQDHHEGNKATAAFGAPWGPGMQGSLKMRNMNIIVDSILEQEYLVAKGDQFPR